ncbi:H+transporting two-sector ATPase alpha/beta subunit central region [Thiorhodococcus drewsii AZ1]|uniref:V-type ATP synthase alpha chain n=1 Tax=Thiorhodococcus drewsii AZ1 TaxID=765913 RepID=G2E4Q7_9GAMM|nr:V-type ATP synthase subunit A [Thiorhodococcus drewsii]EGV29533.1 H+transporting two-sector ATPase alpha/beta subunit central region [Thiorhodococcus drewsii AZ1]
MSIQAPDTHRPDSPARVISVQESLATIEAGWKDGARLALKKNEVVFIEPDRPSADGRQEQLKSEVLRIRGDLADIQVFEDTRGVSIGDPVTQTGEMLSVELGPGLLGEIYDGLQNPLETLAIQHGVFLPRGVDLEALDRNRKWSFVPSVQHGAKLQAGGVLGTVQEGIYTHKIMVPFDEPGEVEVTWIQEGSVTVDTPVARIRNHQGHERSLDLTRRWPVRRALTETMLRARTVERLYPDAPLTTTIRLIDTFFPIARGGTGCIPGPFGAGKTVLQHLLAKHSGVDIVIVVACGERAGEVVETIAEFPQIRDPKTGGSLMDRTIIICNTSSMPVASREASIYTGLTLGEYYRQMGYQVLLLADSTSRWAQAMRETSGRLEEIPGEEAFPAYLDSAIRGLYERAGVVRSTDGSTGSLTLIGTVSPAGGNFEEPVTQSTLGTVKCFLGLSYDRAYKRFYPAIDPLISWSRYLKQLASWYAENLDPTWNERVESMQSLLERGDAVQQMMQVTGEEGITTEDYVELQKAQLLDMVYLQQDAFDAVDASVPLERQRLTFDLLCALIERDERFVDKNAARQHFTRLTNLFKNLNYAATDTPDFERLLQEIRAMVTGNEPHADIDR